IYNVKIITPSPAAFDSNIVINISSPLFSLFEHPIPGNFSLTSTYESIIGAPLSTIEAKVSGQVLTESDIMSIASLHTAYFNTSPVPYYLIYVKMTSWSGVPNSFMSGALNVNFTDQVYLSGNMYSFTQITVPNRFGIEQVVAGYTTLTIASNIQSLQIGVVSPMVSIYYNGVNVTANPSLALSFPNTSTGILSNITVYSPSTATEYSSINVTVTNPATGVKTYVTLPEKGLTGYYEGNLRIVSTSYYSLYAGQPGVISVAPAKVNNISVISTISVGTAYIKGVQTLVDVSGSNYFFVGKIILKPEVTALTVINVSTGMPVSPSNLLAGKRYELFFNMTNVGTVTATVYAVVKITMNTSIALSPQVFVETIAPGKTVTFGVLWTPTKTGSYNITIALFSNPILDIPFNNTQSLYSYTATVSS
ncbi:S-layer protein SlaA, partial [Acidianus sp. RZ1]|uniref:S-layer protein SlaA n=1 Tax=Acidianus sp. RZ1 TaxID=1540082 RepID=UPI00182F85FB